MPGRQRTQLRDVERMREHQEAISDAFIARRPQLHYTTEMFGFWAEAQEAVTEALLQLAALEQALYQRLLEKGKAPIAEPEMTGEPDAGDGGKGDEVVVEEEEPVAVVAEEKPKPRRKKRGVQRVPGCRTSGRLKLR